jgi:MFS family permease
MNQGSLKKVMPIYIGIGLGYFGNFLYIPHLIATIGTSYSGTVAGLIIFLTYLGRLIASLVAGGLADRYGRKEMIVLGSFVEGVALLGFGFCSTIWEYFVLATVVGISSGISFPGLKATLSDLPKEIRGVAFSKFIVASQIGTIVGAGIGALINNASLKNIFVVVFFIFLTYSLSILFLLKSPKDQKSTKPYSPILKVKHPREWEVSQVFGIFVVSSFFWFFYGQFVVGIPLHIKWLSTDLNVSTPFWITGTLTLILQVGLFKKISSHFKEDRLLVAGMIFMILTFFLLGIGINAKWIILSSVAFVISEMLFVPSFDVWISERKELTSSNRAMGTVHFFRSAGNMVGTSTAGIMFDVSRHFNYPGLNWIALGILGSFCTGYLIWKNLNVKANKNPVLAAKQA